MLLQIIAYAIMLAGFVLIAGTIYAEFRSFQDEINRVETTLKRLRGEERRMSFRELLAAIEA